MNTRNDVVGYRGRFAEGKFQIFHHQFLDNLFPGDIEIIVMLFYVIGFDLTPLQCQRLTSLLQDGIPFCQITLG